MKNIRRFFVLECIVAVSAAYGDFPLLSNTSAEKNYDVVFNSQQNEFFVAYSVGGYSMLHRVSSVGALLGSQIYPWSIIVTDQIALAYNPHLDEYLAVTYDNGASTILPGVIALRLNSAGVAVGSLIRVMYGTIHYTADTSRYFRIAFNSTANEYLVTAQMNMGGGYGDVFAQRLSETGVLLGSPVNLTNNPTLLTGHALAYAPIIDRDTPTGRYLFACNGILYMLNSDGNIISVVYDPEHDIWYQAIPFSWGNNVGAVYHPDIAYGQIGDQKLFLVVWGDYNNTDPYNSSQQWTGIWGNYVDAQKLYYTISEPVLDTTFPISAICAHWANTGGSNWWMPRVQFSSAQSSFFVVWRETAADNSCNDTTLYHIRGNRVDYLYLYPPYKNAVISYASGTWPGVQEPQVPALAITPSGKILVTWDDNRNSGAGKERDIYANFWTGLTNDVCANALSVTEGQTLGTLMGATLDGSSGCGGESQPDVWYSYTAPTAGTVQIDTCGTNDLGGTDQGTDTILSVHSGCPGTTANQLACNDDSASGNVPLACSETDIGGTRRDSALSLSMSQGQTILIRITKYSGAQLGSFFLNIAMQPANDECAGALPMVEGSYSFNNSYASTNGPTDPTICSGKTIYSDLWYSYYPTCTGTATVSLCGSSFDTMLAVYNAVCPTSADQALACNDDFCGSSSQVTFSALYGRSYLIRLGSYNISAKGQGQLTVFINPADLNVDCKVDLADLRYLAANWMQTGCVIPTWCGLADINHDGTADMADLSVIISHWLE